MLEVMKCDPISRQPSHSTAILLWTALVHKSLESTVPLRCVISRLNSFGSGCPKQSAWNSKHPDRSKQWLKSCCKKDHDFSLLSRFSSEYWLPCHPTKSQACWNAFVLQIHFGCTHFWQPLVFWRNQIGGTPVWPQSRMRFKQDQKRKTQQMQEMRKKRQPVFQSVPWFELQAGWLKFEAFSSTWTNYHTLYAWKSAGSIGQKKQSWLRIREQRVTITYLKIKLDVVFDKAKYRQWVSNIHDYHISWIIREWTFGHTHCLLISYGWFIWWNVYWPVVGRASMLYMMLTCMKKHNGNKPTKNAQHHQGATLFLRVASSMFGFIPCSARPQSIKWRWWISLKTYYTTKLFKS